LRFKEKYYGYKDAVINWKKLQENNLFPAKLADFFNWVSDDTQVDKVENRHIKPIININK